MRRLMGFIVAAEAIEPLVRQGYKQLNIDSGIPASAVFYTAYYEVQRNAFVLVFEDPSFPPLTKGSVIPIADSVVITELSPFHYSCDSNEDINPKKLKVTVHQCARCGKNHWNMGFFKFKNPPLNDTMSQIASHWAVCPATSDPVLLTVVEQDKETET